MADETLLTLTAEIVTAHLVNNKVATGDVAALVTATYQALAGVGVKAEESEPPLPEFTPATTARKSLADPARIVSMIDGKAYTSLTRHLHTHGLTPAEYRRRYELKDDYPMVAPGYSEKRRAISLELGLGRKKAPAPASAPEPDTAEAKPARKRGRPKKVGGDEAPKQARGRGQQQAELVATDASIGEPQSDKADNNG